MTSGCLPVLVSGRADLVKKDGSQGEEGDPDESQLHRCSFLCKQASHHMQRAGNLGCPWQPPGHILSCHGTEQHEPTHLHMKRRPGRQNNPGSQKL
jgi:hypothetical protein